jgi:DNA-directed RNA polymerase specialized sigma24 family protein
MTDPFATVRQLASDRSRADWALREEVAYLRAAGFSYRAIGEAAGIAADTVWRWVR